jgi:superoxide reductase
MSCEKKFYKCGVCGNLVEMVHVGGGTLVCCGQDMNLLVANSVEASTEKHIPVVDVKDGKVTVTVGSVAHPMTEEHLIQWIYLCTETTGKLVYLKANDQPTATFCLDESGKGEVFAYCNLHGLWSVKF